MSALAILRVDRDMPEARCRISPQRVRRVAHHRIGLVVSRVGSYQLADAGIERVHSTSVRGFAKLPVTVKGH